ncbi:MAG: hypothetical protein ACREV4_14600 [Gammaproteobacteria bacterium]
MPSYSDLFWDEIETVGAKLAIALSGTGTHQAGAKTLARLADPESAPLARRTNPVPGEKIASGVALRTRGKLDVSVPEARVS